jgi:hypothetical protein
MRRSCGRVLIQRLTKQLSFVRIIPKFPAECKVRNENRRKSLTRAVGMQVFLLDKCIINKKDLALEQFPRGGFAELKDFLLNHI